MTRTTNKRGGSSGPPLLFKWIAGLSGSLLLAVMLSGTSGAARRCPHPNPKCPETSTTTTSTTTSTSTTSSTSTTTVPSTSTTVSGGALHQNLGFNSLSSASDEFTGTLGSKPSSTKWDTKTFSGNNSSVYWNGWNNVQLDGLGNVDVFAIRQSSSLWTSSWLSGKIAYKGPHFLEARAKVAEGNGPWSAPIWEWDAPYGSAGTENDVSEQLGREPQSYHSTLHLSGSQSGRTISTSVVLASGYHVYAAAVYNDHVDYYFDNQKVQTISKSDFGGNWAFDTTSMILNISLDMGGWGGTIDPSLPSPVHMLVDYIRVYTP